MEPCAFGIEANEGDDVAHNVLQLLLGLARTTFLATQYFDISFFTS